MRLLATLGYALYASIISKKYLAIVGPGGVRHHNFYYSYICFSV